MENTLTVIHQQNVLGQKFQVYGTIQEPLFLAKDVASWIEHSDVSTMLRSVDEDEKVTNIVCTLGGNQKSWFLTESGRKAVTELWNKRNGILSAMN
jgi:prophage antirepressor-like protein